MNSHIPLAMLNYEERRSLYARTSFNYLNMDAIFSDETENYVTPPEPTSEEPVTIKIRVYRNNVDDVFLNAGGIRTQLVKIENTDTDSLFDFYAVTMERISERIDYFFTIVKNGRSYFYNKRGLNVTVDENFNFRILPNFKTPEWAKGAVMYQIFVDRFYNGDPSNDTVNNEYAYMGKASKHIENWNQEPANLDICNFYGGDLAGVMQKMAYLKDLGVEVIYFTPIFVSPSTHKYDTQDYDYIDPHFGVIIEDGGEPLYFEKFHNRFATMYTQRTTTKSNLEASNELMAKLISLAHENGIRVILDGVFNHCGAFNKWLDKEKFYSGKGYANGAYYDQNSPYHDYFQWYDSNWPNNDCYDSWWGHDNHPKLNFEKSPELYQYMLDVGAKWVSEPYHADGWRLDVAADLGYSPDFNHQFWRDFRKAVKNANPNAIILAELYGDPSSWLQGDQWDTIMNYDAFMEPITWFLTGMEKHSEEFRGDMLCNGMAFENGMRYHMSKFSVQSLQTSMNELSNHDHSRFLTRTNMQVGRLHTKGALAASEGINKNIMMEAVTFQMTWPGAPTVYYGDEAGVSGWTDPDNRRTYPWGSEDKTLLRLHKDLIAIHKQYAAFKKGSVEFLLIDYGLISYGRWDVNHKLITIINNNGEQKQIKIPVWKIQVKVDGNMETLLLTGANSFSLDKIRYPVENGYLTITLPPHSSMILIEK